MSVPDPADVRAVMVARGHRGPDDDLPVTPPEYRLYASIKKSEARLAEIAVLVARRKADEAEIARERARQAETGTWGWRVRAARSWARKNGYPIGARGRVPASVMSAFGEAIDKGALNMSKPDFRVGDRVTHWREPERIGTVFSIRPDRYSNEHITNVQWVKDGPAIPYRSGLTLHTQSAAPEATDDAR